MELLIIGAVALVVMVLIADLMRSTYRRLHTGKDEKRED